MDQKKHHRREQQEQVLISSCLIAQHTSPDACNDKSALHEARANFRFELPNAPPADVRDDKHGAESTAAPCISLVLN